jgi:ribose 5-phosphate isomerase A
MVAAAATVCSVAMAPQDMNPKLRAARAALDYVTSDTVIGLGTGSTADLFLIELAEALKSGRLRNLRGVCTSQRTQRRAAELGIPIVELEEVDKLDVAIDGADEITPSLDLIKGLGGALLREKMVVQAAKRFIVIADASKRVEALGTKAALPVEVVQFAHRVHERFFRTLGCVPTLRMNPDGQPFMTDNANLIYDCKFSRIDDPKTLAAKLADRAGVVESGLFLGIASAALIADEKQVATIQSVP